jgi:hypothetical protein
LGVPVKNAHLITLGITMKRAISGNDLPSPDTFFTVEDDAVAVGRERADRARHMAMKRKEFRKIRRGVVAVVVGSLAIWAAIWAAVAALNSWMPS